MSQPRNTLKICVGYHKPSFLLKGDCFVPVWGGKAVANTLSKDGKGLSAAEQTWMEEHCIGDDTGDNISAKNRYYNESTILYWMWKNYDKLGNPDWIGFLQYRRHWVLDPVMLALRNTTTHYLMIEPAFTDDYQEKIKLSPENLQKELARCDGIFCANDTAESVYTYKSSHHSQDVKWWDKTLEIIRRDWPQYAPAAEAFNKNTWQAWSNCFIMRREDFLAYCPFLFDVLGKIDQLAAPTYNSLTPEQMRIPGYVAETMLGIFWTYLKQKKKRLKSFPLIYIQKPFELPELLPRHIFPVKPGAVAVVFIADNNYLPFTAVTISSIIAHANAENFYDIILLHDRHIPPDSQERLQQNLPGNVSVRFFNAAYYLKKYNFTTFWSKRLHFLTYLKGFIHEILSPDYQKALFLDGDLITRQDIAELYNTPLDGYALAAVQDYVNAYDQAPFWQAKRIYCVEQGHMKDPAHYFNSGVMLLNLKVLREDKTFVQQFVMQSQFTHPGRTNHDQDSLNFILEGKVKLISPLYNFQCALTMPIHADFLPTHILQEVEQNRRAAHILHFDGDKCKPWKLFFLNVQTDTWWKYARLSPFYEQLLGLRYHPLPAGAATQKITWKTRARYYKYKMLSAVLWGKRRMHYQEKTKKYLAVLHPKQK